MSVRELAWLFGAALVAAAAGSGAQPATPEADAASYLEFQDGSILHGQLARIDPSTGLRWKSPAALEAVDFQPRHLGAVHFARDGGARTPCNCRLRFANGDDLLGTITSLDNDRLKFSAWFGGELTVARAAVEAITFLPTNYAVVYQGPSDAEGWIIGNRNPDSWVFHDNEFIGASPGALARDFNLTGSSTIEFDLSWNESFELMADIYCEAGNRMDFANSYMVEFTRDQVNLRHVTASPGQPVRSFGSAKFTLPPEKNSMHVAIQSNKGASTIAVYVNGQLVRRWKDENGFTAAGTGVLFQQQVMSGATVRLGNFQVSQWDGKFEPDFSATPTGTDTIHFVNRDSAAGKITGISPGAVTFDLGSGPLPIPVQRITQLTFATNTISSAPRGPWDVRARLVSGGTVSFQLKGWDANAVSGLSGIFGPVAFQPAEVRSLEFNLDWVRPGTRPGPNRELDGLDE